jgi:hypothetical protein
MNKYLKIALYGFVGWLIPFLASFPFYTRDGVLRVDIYLFKSLMIVVGTLVAAILLIKYFKKVKANYVNEGITVGLIWFLIFIVLDLVVLVPMSGMNYNDYFVQIGLRYLAVPIISTTVGVVLQPKRQ